MILDRPHQERVIDSPEPGDFVVRAYRGGPWLPARIERVCCCTIGGSVPHDWTDACDRYPQLSATINGKPSDPSHVWAYGRSAKAIAIQDERPLSERPPIF